LNVNRFGHSRSHVRSLVPTSFTLRDRQNHERHSMSNTQAAVALGASGSVGNALVKELIRVGSFEAIVTLLRRSQRDQVAMARAARVELRSLAHTNTVPRRERAFHN
jgi:hypothetical protein